LGAAVARVVRRDRIVLAVRDGGHPIQRHALLVQEKPNRLGALLAVATEHAAVGTEVTVRRLRCLANCTRGPSAAMRCNGSWTYVFGGLDTANAAALVEGARLLAGAVDGILPWRGRPDVLKRGLIARVPPLDFEEVDP